MSPNQPPPGRFLLRESRCVSTDAVRKRKELLVEFAVLLLELWHRKPATAMGERKERRLNQLAKTDTGFHKAMV